MRKDFFDSTWMKWLAFIAFICFVILCCGCSAKTYSANGEGVWATDRGTLAVGTIEVQAIPEGEDAALIKYSEDFPMLASIFGDPEKMRNLGITLTGSNSVRSATGIVKEICTAFVSVSTNRTEVAKP